MLFRSRWGHVLALATLGFAVICSTAQAQIVFSSPKNVSNNTDFSFTPQVAEDSAGNIFAVWEDDTNTNSNILFSASTDGGVTFSTPKSLSNSKGNSFNPHIMVDSQNHINVVWEDDTPGPRDVFFSHSTDGGANFSTPVNLSNDSVDSSSPKVAADSTGNVFAVWENDSGLLGVMFSRSLDGGATFSAPVFASTNAGGSMASQIAVDAAGNINLVWEDTISSSSQISFARSQDHGATFSSPKSLSNSGNSNSPQIALDLIGNINIVWANDSPGNFDVFYTRSTDGGQNFSALLNLSNSPGSAATPLLATDLGGNINVIWSENSAIFFARSSNAGTSFSAPKNVSNGAGSSINPSLAVDSGGNINLAWQVTSGNRDIFFSRSTDGGATFFAAPQNLSQNTGLSTVPQIIADKNGSLNVIWQDSTGGISQILFSRFTNAVVNHPPTADAGADQTLQAAGQNGVSVTLDGSKSSDPDGDTLTYSWTDQNNNIVGTTAVVQLNLLPGKYTFTLTVTDPGKLASSATTHVTVLAPPVANAGSDQTVQATGQNGVSVTLDGSKSSDPNGDTLTYSWTDQNNQVVGSTAIVQLTLLPGTYTFTLTVTDTDKLSSSATTHVTVNPPVNRAPIADAGPDQTVQGNEPTGALVQLDGSKSSDPDGDKLTYIWIDQGGHVVGSTAVVQLTLLPGNYTFTLTVTDPGKLSSSATTHVTVNASVNHPPVANAGAGQALGCTGQNGTSVTLDGSKSSDPDGDTLTYVWRDAAGNIVGTTAIAKLTLPSGMYKFQLTVTDPGGLSSSAWTRVAVQDTTAPTLSVSLSPNSLSPPNHKLVPIYATVSASDACSANVAVSLVSIFSNEPDNGTGDGDQPNDIQAIGGGPVPFGTDVRSFQLRAERSGGGDGRIYKVTYSATDAAGNATSATAYVVVGATLTEPPSGRKHGGRGYSNDHDDRDRDKDHDNKDHDKDKNHDKDRKGDH